jgi:UDP-2,3-diacylglucosamine pyrophosphatase LpxH
MNAPSKKQLLVISDLHLLSERSIFTLNLQPLYNIISNKNILVLNGDIFDLKWSIIKKEKVSEYINAFFKKCSELADEVYFIYGNHESYTEQKILIENAVKNLDNVKTYEHYFIFNEHFFTHSDLEIGKKPARSFKPKMHYKNKTISKIYGFIIFLRIGNLVAKFFTANYCAPKLHSHNKSIIEQNNIKNVYFGHTHLPFNNYIYNEITFSNTGSAVKYMGFNPIIVEYEN